jgi:hypothetical protein
LRSLQEIQPDFEEETKAYAGLWSQGKKKKKKKKFRYCIFTTDVLFLKSRYFFTYPHIVRTANNQRLITLANYYDALGEVKLHYSHTLRICPCTVTVVLVTYHVVIIMSNFDVGAGFHLFLYDLVFYSLMF